MVPVEENNRVICQTRFGQLLEALAGLTVPKRRELEWELKDPNGQKLATGKGVADDHGAWALDVALPADGAIGDHGLEVRRGEDRTYVNIPTRA